MKIGKEGNNIEAGVSKRCPECSGKNTSREVCLEKEFNPRVWGNPFRCKDCQSIFFIREEGIPYSKHLDIIREQIKQNDKQDKWELNHF